MFLMKTLIENMNWVTKLADKLFKSLLVNDIKKNILSNHLEKKKRFNFISIDFNISVQWNTSINVSWILKWWPVILSLGYSWLGPWLYWCIVKCKCAINILKGYIFITWFKDSLKISLTMCCVQWNYIYLWLKKKV